MSRPSSFHALKNFVVVKLRRLSTTFKWTAARAPPNKSQLISLCWKQFFRPDGMKLFKNIQSYGLAVLPQTRPSSFDGVEKNFCFHVMQPFKSIQVYGWAALLNIPCHGPAHFKALKNLFVVMLWWFSATFKWTAGRAPPNKIQLISRCSTLFSFRWYGIFQKQSSLWLSRALSNTTQFLSRCWRTFLCGS